MAEVRPNVVVEVGTWKGASLLRMHRIARELGLDCQFVCIDTWLGSSEHWLNPKERHHLRLEGGRPELHRQFVFNLIASDATDVFPLPMTSVAAAEVLHALGIQADLVYIDAGHSEREVAADLECYLPVLRPGGVLFGDDYHPSWPGLVRSVDAFVREHRLELELERPVWIARTARDNSTRRSLVRRWLSA